MSRQFATNVTTIYDILCPVPFLPSPFGFRLFKPICPGENRQKNCHQKSTTSFSHKIAKFHHLELLGPLSCKSRAANLGGFQMAGFPDLDLSFLFCPFFVLFGTFPIFPGFSRFARGWSGDFPDSSLFLFLGLLRAPTRNSPERVRDTIWTFPEKSGKHPGLETPRV